jgi:hypothetical protein
MADETDQSARRARSPGPVGAAGADRVERAPAELLDAIVAYVERHADGLVATVMTLDPGAGSSGSAARRACPSRIAGARHGARGSGPRRLRHCAHRKEPVVTARPGHRSPLGRLAAARAGPRRGTARGVVGSGLQYRGRRAGNAGALLRRGPRSPTPRSRPSWPSRATSPGSPSTAPAPSRPWVGPAGCCSRFSRPCRWGFGSWARPARSSSRTRPPGGSGARAPAATGVGWSTGAVRPARRTRRWPGRSRARRRGTSWCASTCPTARYAWS